VAFTFANALEYLDRAKAAGLDINTIAPRISFFFAAHNDLFEEVAKFRAARRLWARLVKERYDGDEQSCRLRFHTQTGGSTLTAQQPMNNIVRVAVQAMAAVLGGTQSLHTNGFDEALALPTREAAMLALRTQQILAHETGVPSVVDPFGGSYFVEKLTDDIEAGARALLAEVAGLGGAAKAIQEGFFQRAIAQAAYQYQKDIEAERAVVVGVNQFTDTDEVPARILAPDYSKLAAEQVKRVRSARKKRDQKTWRAALDQLAVAAKGPDALMPRIIDAVKARATVGEIADQLRAVWGTFQG
jgi:methylmalonyl-CoA mutase N-terminal domain/subunit